MFLTQNVFLRQVNGSNIIYFTCANNTCAGTASYTRYIVELFVKANI